MRKLFIALLGALLCASSVNAQNPPVIQGGQVTPGHIAQWLTNGVIGDGGTPGTTIFTGSTTVNDFACVGASNTLIDCGISGVSTSAWTGLQNFNGGATAPTRNPGDNTTNLANTAFVTAIFGAANTWTALQNFSGGATAPTRSLGDNTTNVATTAFVVANSSGIACLGAGAFPVGTGSVAQCSTTAGSTAILNGAPLTLNASGFALPRTLVFGETPNLTLSGAQNANTQGETILLGEAIGANSNFTLLMSKSGGGSTCIGNVVGTVYTVTGGCSNGTVAVGQVVLVTGVPTGTTIASLGTGAGGNGTYNLSQSGTVAGGSTILTNDNPATPTPTLAGQYLGFLIWSGWYSNAGTITPTNASAVIRASTVGNFTSSNWASNIDFLLTPVNSILNGGGGLGTPAVSFVANAAGLVGGTITQTLNAVGTTVADGIVLQNQTAAAAGAQQESPSLHWIGQGWKTNATAASQTVDWIVTNLPGQGAANPTTSLVVSYQINAGGYSRSASFQSSGIFDAVTGYSIGAAAGSAGNVLRSDGTKAVFAALATTDLSDVTAAGSWTPSDQSGASLTFTGVSVSYTKIGNMVFVYGRFSFPATGSGANVSIGGLPVASANQNYASSPGSCNSNGTISVSPQPTKNTTTFSLLNAVTGAAVTNTNMSGQILNCSFSYSTT
jgi:hypothetical protein